MPLHLLHKKSYHVYNDSNVTRVRADEAAAAAAEHAREERMQAVDAARRLAILRGETPPPLPEPEPEIDPSSQNFARRDNNSTTGFGTRKRKRKGEDDTDFEVRVARERAEMGGRVTEELASHRQQGKKVDIDIVGKDGHIDLVGAPPKDEKAEKNAEYEKEAARKKRELEDQYTMRFSNAAGRDGFAVGDPWYASSTTRTRSSAPILATKEAEVGIEAPTKNVWGRDDPKRQDREIKRIISNDPLSMMRMGAKKVREIENERRLENEERQRELKELEKDARRREKRRRKESRDGEDNEGHRHRSSRSEHSRRRHHDDDREERRHRPRDDPDRSRSHEGESQRERVHNHDRERTRDHSRLSRSHEDHEDHRGHSRGRDGAR